MQQVQPFHLAVPVDNLQAARKFYKEILGCEEGRSSDHWVDFNFFGHQFVIHYKESTAQDHARGSNPVDGKSVPVPHFGVILKWEVFHKFANELRDKKIDFVIEPYVRFEGQVGEQATMFFKDPCGNALEFKAFRDQGQIFAK